MRAATLLLPLMLVSGLTSVSYADDDRFELEKSANGYIRMDKTTGAMSICEERSGQLICKLAADERAAFQDEADRLQTRLSALEGRVAELEKAGSARGQALLPSEEDFTKSLGYMERFFRKFFDIVQDMDKEFPNSSKEPELPKKT